MSFFRRLSSHRRSRNGRADSCPPAILHLPPNDAANDDDDVVAGYERQIQDLGQLLSEQGRALDEHNNRSRRLSDENSILRDRLASTAVVKPLQSSSPQRATPLKNIINVRSASKDDANTKQLIQRQKEDKDILIQQSELLANELADANKCLAERDETIGNLGKELSKCLDKARSLMIEKRTWKTDSFQKTKDNETLENQVKRLSETTQQLECERAIRSELESEVTDLTTQLSSLASKCASQANDLLEKNKSLEVAETRRSEAEHDATLHKQEAKMNADTAQVLQDNIRRNKAQKDSLEAKLKEIQVEVAEYQLSQHKLNIQNKSLQGSADQMVVDHKLQITNWTKGQNKIVVAMREQHQEDVQSKQKLIDNLRRTNTSLVNDSAQTKRDLQSCQQRCSSLEKLLSSRESDHTDIVTELLQKAKDVETKLVKSLAKEIELKSSISTLEEQLLLCNNETKEQAASQTKVIEELKKEQTSLRDKNKALSRKISQLEEDLERVQTRVDKDKQTMKDECEQKVREIDVECKSLQTRNESEQIKLREAKDLMDKQSSLYQSTLGELTAEKKELDKKMSNMIADEREVSVSLMIKVQAQADQIKDLTNEKNSLVTACNKGINQVYTLEKIIATGDAKMSNFSKQLARSLQDQEARIMKEAELKKELNLTRMELNKLRQ